MEYFRVYDTIDSTNREAARLLASGENLHGIAVLAHHQTDGRGQYGRSWHSAPDSHLAMSIILQPASMLLGDLPLLSIKASLAVVRTIKTIEPSLSPAIKWPNDIYINDLKLAGILIENSISAKRVQYSIVGAGMNVNEKSFPKDIPNAVSLFLLTGQEYNVLSIADQLRMQLLSMVDESIESWKPEYDLLIYGLGKQHGFELDGKKVKAKILGVDPNGKIRLDFGHFTIKTYYSHEIKWLK